MFVIFDLDGTLCNIEHRLHHIQGGTKNWDAFYADCIHDEPIIPMLNVLETLQKSEYDRVQIWTGRSEVVKTETLRWFEIYGLFFTSEDIKMRPRDNRTPDHILKEQWLQKENIKPHMVFEDRKRVVDMWRKNGILCTHVADGEF